MESLFHLFWNARFLSKLLFIGGFVLAGWLVVRCSGDVEIDPDLRQTSAPLPKLDDDELLRALDASRAETMKCIAAVKATFVRDQLAGTAPSKPAAAKPPARAADLKDARAFEAAIPHVAIGEVATFAPASDIPIRGLEEAGVYRRADRDSICGIEDRRAANAAWGKEISPALLAKLRAPKAPPPLVVVSWRWCDRGLLDPRPITCSVGLAWIEQPSGKVVASATGVGTGKPVGAGSKVDYEKDPYVVAMKRAEQKVRDAVLAWK